MPRKSSSLLIFKKDLSKKTNYNYKMLMMQRKSKMSFANSYGDR